MAFRWTAGVNLRRRNAFLSMDPREPQDRIRLSCVVPGCMHHPWGRTPDDLRSVLARSGWVETQYGWICADHHIVAKAFKEATK